MGRKELVQIIERALSQGEGKHTLAISSILYFWGVNGNGSLRIDM